jgi:UDP-N-acetylmuramoyl-tripeptide--D-alanyl-D-alanine ligase
MKFRVEEVVGATRGHLAAGRPDAIAGSVSTDSRVLEAGQTFLALRGERFDAHYFLCGALARGAVCLIVDREDKVPWPAVSAAGAAVVVVRDTLEALADLARAARRRLACPVIAVTGSCGKTTLKEMLGQILMRHLRGRRAPASFNNQIGVPLTLLAAEPDDEFVLCEFGTNAPGEMAALASIARPTIGIVTVVAKVHVERLGSIEGVAREKGDLVAALGRQGTAILNADDPRVAAMAALCGGRVVTVGLRVGADLVAEDVVQTERAISFTVGGETGFEVPVLGEHHVLLALESAAAARELGVSLADSAAALREFQPPPGRLRLEQRGDLTILNDAFNANPLSMQVALAQLALWPDRRKVFFAGDMRELGSDSRAEHEALGRAIVGAGVRRLICVGRESQATARAAVAAGLRADDVTTVEDSAAAAAMAPSLVRDGDVVLVKGSHAVHMEHVVEALSVAFSV